MRRVSARACPGPSSLDQASLFHPLEVDAHAVGMQLQALGELDRPSRPLELSEQREQLRPGGLSKYVVRVDGGNGASIAH